LLCDMVADLRLAHRALLELPGVDPTRVSIAGFSMGGTLAYLYAALHTEVAACAQLIVFSDIAPLIATGMHDLHGHYMTIGGLLPDHDMGDISALVAPRRQLICTGEKDPLTPDAGYGAAVERVRCAYAAEGALANLKLLRDPHAGHEETREMRSRVLAFLQSA
ncbi:MAG: dienelactone hydrolase family protein, partial [Pseudomonadota bacterium]